MFANIVASILALCGRAQKEERELVPMVYCDFGCGVHKHGRANDEESKPRERVVADLTEVPEKEYGRYCRFKQEVRTQLSCKAQERCLSKAPLQAPELPDFHRRDTRRPCKAQNWMSTMGIPHENPLWEKPIRDPPRLRFLPEHQVQKYDVDGPPFIVRRSEDGKGSRAVEFVSPVCSLSFGRVHPKARDRTNAEDEWSNHGHMVDYS
ncbi:hypothetical protein E4T39_07996 [Aureobasidium subglaciale]|nr:hypothetical protein E4T39_07996 [Aureobasidium subglaciale]